MDWNDVPFFLALARTGSVRAAGASLGVSHSTVARRVEALEDQLGTRLFDRSRDGFALTEAGERMQCRAERVEAEMASLERDLAGQDERLAGTVSITCCDEYVSELLIAPLAKFCEAYPAIDLRFVADSRPFDLSKREADIAIRIKALGAQPAGHLLGRKLVPLTMASYVAVAHADRLDPERPGSAPRWLGFEDRKIAERMVADSSYPDAPLWGEMVSLPVMAQAARAGLGMVMLPTYVGDPDPALRRLAQADARHVADVWLLSHPDLRDNARLIKARECVAEAILAQRALFEGKAS